MSASNQRRMPGWLETLLWIAGFAALGYCAFVTVDADLTQARLARALPETHEAVFVNIPESSPVPAPPASSGEIRANKDLVGRLEIPSIALSSMVLEGAGARTLRVAIGHVPGTPEPGQRGNVVLAGHRDSFFRPLRQIKLKDEISLDTGHGKVRYRVTSVKIVDPTDVAVLRSRDRNELTLITCYPFFYIGPAPKRFVVQAVQVSEGSSTQSSRAPLFTPD